MKTYLDNNRRKIYIAIHFGKNKKLINEFVRIFSVFYDKIGKSKYMQGVEIALASKSHNKYSDKSCDEVNFIISGEDYVSAYLTANTFVYYNSDSSAEFVPLLQYLTKSGHQENVVKNEISIFPFDLYLKGENESSWFINKMSCILDNNIQYSPYGCKIPNVHIRLSSRLHLDTFYEAELLFHNISNVYRFAYIIAKDIIKDIDTTKPKTIIILGYENYSSILIQQIADWVKNSAPKSEVSTAIITNVEDTVKIQYLEGKTNGKKTYCYTIIPIGTTMSTIYKVHNVYLKENKKVDFRYNYSLVCVSDNVENTEEIQNNEIVKRYWKAIDAKSKTITLLNESMRSEGINVKYIIKVKTKWHNINDCELCKNNIPLIQVDKTSTIPNSIFELKNNHREFIEGYCKDMQLFMPSIDKEMNVQEIVKYAHLCRGNNHYQFYFDFQELVRRSESRIAKWAKSIPIDDNAYNIVISPLSLSNTKFLKLVIDNTFSSSLRFLHIDINNTYKEDIRAKFSFISQEYKRIKSLNKNAKICFYYIDDAIVTGQTINRARMLLKMLVEEANLGLKENIYFEKVFLLLNRSSYDTARTFVENVQTDYCCFFNIEIPSYNTSSNFCPGCSIQDQYQLLLKRSASENLSSEFLRLTKKHQVRTPEEYEKWLTHQIGEGYNYFSYLTSFLFYSDGPEEIAGFLNKQKIKVAKYLELFYKKYCEKDLEKGYDKYIEAINSININRYIVETNQENDKEKIINLVRFIIAKKAYKRLVSMNKSYALLSRINQFNNESTDSLESTKSIILELMANAKKPEDIISFVKVISREHLSKYYHIRCAIVQIMIELLKVMISNEISSNDKTMKIVELMNKDDYSQQKYHLILTIIHRLAMLQTTEVLSYKTAHSVLSYLNNYYYSYLQVLKENMPDKKELLLVFPNKKETMVNQYMKSLKTATMLNNDDALCNKLFELSKSLLGSEDYAK